MKKSDARLIIALSISVVCCVALFLSYQLTADNYAYLLSRRIPKLIALMVAAVAIAQSSLVFQTITHNRILTPSIMGFDALYLLIQVILLISLGQFSQWLLNPYLNFSLTVFLLSLFSILLFGFFWRYSLFILLLVGIVLGELFANLANFFLLLMDPDNFASLQKAMFASFNQINSTLTYFSLSLMLILVIILGYYARLLDVFWLGREQVISLGINIKSVTYQLLICISIMVAIATSLVGPVLFFGLLVTNLSRQLMQGYAHQWLLIFCALLAMNILIAGQWVVEHVLQFSVSLSVLINALGGIYLISLLSQQKEKLA